MGSSDGLKAEKQDFDISSSGLQKLMKGDNSWDRDQLGDTLHWIRQGIALICGVLWGVLPVTGFLWFLIFAALSTGAIYGIYSVHLKVDAEEFGGDGALLQEGLFASMTLFLLAWTLVYSLVHF